MRMCFFCRATGDPLEEEEEIAAAAAVAF